MKKSLILFILFTFATAGNSQNIPSYIPTNGLIGWWPFNGNANDESGNNNHGSLNGASLTVDRYNIPNAAYDFDGINDYIHVSGSNIPIYGKTFSIWVKADVLQNSPKSILEHGSTSSSRWALRIKSNQIESVFGIGCAGNTTAAQTANSMNTNKWSHIVMRDNGGDTLEIFLNDTLVSTQTVINHGGNCSTSGLFIGVDIFSIAEYFNGALDDIGVWNRQLSISEIHSLYESKNCQDSLTTQPQSGTFNIVPGTALFTTGYSDTSASYQWQQNNGTGWVDLSDFGVYSGTSTDSLMITAISMSMNGYGYRCLVNGCTLDTTEIATLTVVDNIGLYEETQPLFIYPNPSKGEIFFDSHEGFNFLIYSMDGKLVMTGRTQDKIDIHTLPQGSYIVKIQFEHQEIFTKIFRKE